jgi:tRNA (uracil-5-)-methyltransferase TRM9
MQTQIIDCYCSIDSLNQNFYEKVYADFSSSRQYYWQGWHQLTQYLLSPNTLPVRVLDLGCGNGRFAQFLLSLGLQIEYVGVDFSQNLIDTAHPELKLNPNITLIAGNMFEYLQSEVANFDLIVSFGVLHHIYSIPKRNEFFDQIANLSHLNTDIILTTWQFMDSPELAKKVLSTEQMMSITELVDTGIIDCLGDQDYILDWNRGVRAFRYGHYYLKSEIASLATAAGLKIVSDFLDDGKNGNGNRYYIITKSH